jgi:hypothetical protein
MKGSTMIRYLLCAAALAAASVTAAACEKKIEGPSGAVAFRVTKFDPAENWGESAPLEFTGSERVFTFTVEPVGSFDGWVKIDVQPGLVMSLLCDPPACGACDPARAIGSNMLVAGGPVSACLGLKLAYGKTHILVKDIGFVPAPPGTAACGDGLDNDNDGFIDYGDDGGCAYANDDSETGGEYIVGASPDIVFENPRIEDVQGGASVSPLSGQAVTISAGTLIITRISSEGFYVTDITPRNPGGGYNSIYAFNFNTPWGMRECDQISMVDGIVGEFLGFTELSYPAWQVMNADARVEVPQSPADCPIPEPLTLTPELLADVAGMEAYEAGLVQVLSGVITPSFISCDLNGDGLVEYEGEEDACAADCNENPDCTELTQYFQYGQWNLNAGGTKVFVVSQDAYPDFDPRANAGQALDLVRGTLKHIEFIEPPWIMEIRCREDLVFQGGEIKPMYQACVPPEPRGRHYDDN